MIAAADAAEAQRIVAELSAKLATLDGEPALMVRTFNTVTFCRPWPERHVQVVLFFTRHVHEMLLLADLDCTSMALVDGMVVTSQRSRRALRDRCNIVPAPMLEIRKDTPQRMAKYLQRGFAAHFLGTPDPQLLDLVHKYLSARRPLLDLSILSFNWGDHEEFDGQLDEEQTANYLLETNTCYSPANLPRCIGMTSGILRDFLARKDPESILTHERLAQVVECKWKLTKIKREDWLEWRMTGDID